MKMRNPNGYGSVVELNGKRRKPFAVRITIGWDNNGKQKYKYLGTFATKKEAEHHLVHYNENPYNIEIQSITFLEVYEKWKNEKFETVGHSAQLGYIAAFKKSEPLHSIKFVDLKASHLQEIVLNPDVKYGTKRKIKVLFNQLYNYAMKNDIVSKDYSKYIDIGKNTEENDRRPFTTEEIERLWELVKEHEWIDTILIMIYTGFRIGELLEIKNSDVDLENRIVKGGLKTEVGKDRIVPIHSKIIDFIKERMNPENEYLIVNSKGEQMKYNNYYREKFEPLMEQLGMKHKPHDTRHTFATLLSNAEANKTSIKKLIGHNSYTTTEKFYTHKDIEELRKAVEKI
jgi:site-specific recombinase, phage integrase family